MELASLTRDLAMQVEATMGDENIIPILMDRKAGLRALAAIPPQCYTLLAWIDAALSEANRDTSYIALLTNFVDKVWRERNDRLFNSKIRQDGILRNTYREVDAFPTKSCSEATLQTTRTAKQTLERWINTWKTWNRGASMHRPSSFIDRPDPPGEHSPGGSSAEGSNEDDSEVGSPTTSSASATTAGSTSSTSVDEE
ncbi:hypothetical protein R1sor_006689 [Riccia sorocarpa]|uniref:Uncharacterized protein n=1 Tax=Riccia sorocarpa TaxID=122646 RepID=A0ABD3HNM7_9MARC